MSTLRPSRQVVGDLVSELPSILVALCLALTLYYFLNLAFGLLLLVFFVIAPLGGVLATADDDLPGGWSNPDGRTKPFWLTAKFWALVLLRASLVGLGSVIDVGLNRVGLLCILTSIALFSISISMLFASRT